MSKVRFGRLHKRPFVVGMIVLLSFLLVGAFFVSYLGFFARGADLDRVRVGAEETGLQVQGFGVSIDHIPTANYIVNSSFENIQMDDMFTVQEGFENYVFLMPDPDQVMTHEEGIFEGGTIRVVALDAEGRLYQKMSSDVEAFEVNQLGLWREFDNMPDNIGEIIRFVSASDNQIVGFGDDGYIVVGIGTADTFVIQMDVEGLCVASNYADGRFSALYSDGTVITSTDGRNFNAFYHLTDAEEESVFYNTISSFNRVVVSAGDGGRINVLSDGQRHDIVPVSDADIYAAAGDGNAIILVGENGELITTANGTIFRRLSVEERPNDASRFDWVSAACGEGMFVLAGEDGQLAVGQYDSAKGRFSFEMKMDTQSLSEIIMVQDILIDASGEIIMLDHQGLVYIFDQNSQDWRLLSTDNSGDVLSLHSAPGRKIVLLTEESIFTTSLLIRVQFAEHLSDIDLAAGDMCYLSRRVPTFEANQMISNGGHWHVFGEDTTVMSVSDAPVSGANMSLRITGQTGEANSAHFISQSISREGQAVFSENVFYRVDLYLKQNGLESGEVMVWLSGDFDSVGTTFSDVGTGWRRYSFRFVMPREACGPDIGDIRFNIGFYGDGEVFVDNVYLGRDTHASDEIADQFSEQIISASPDFIRFPSLSLGEQGLATDAFFSIPGNDRLVFVEPGRSDATGMISIESALRLSRSADAYPWFVVGSSAGQEHINTMMSYLCGSISDPIAKIRIDNGTAVPWSRQFDRFVLEISDSDSIFISDIQRGAYVNYVIELLEASPYYLDIKDKVIIVDGMNYDGGVMLSEADYHASALYVEESVVLSSLTLHERLDGIISGAYLDYYDGIPRVTARPVDTGGQWIYASNLFLRSFDEESAAFNMVPYPIDAAMFVHFLLNDYGRHTSMICYDIQVSDNPYDLTSDLLFSDSSLIDTQVRQTQSENNAVMFKVMNVLSDHASGIPNYAVITPSLSDVSERVRIGEEGVDSNNYAGLIVYAFSDEEEINIIIVNISDQPRSFMIETDFFSREISVFKYSEDANLVTSSSSRRSNARYVLLPGQFLVASGPVDESVFDE